MDARHKSGVILVCMIVNSLFRTTEGVPGEVKECGGFSAGEYLNGNNVERLANCELLVGNLVINNSSFNNQYSLTADDLSKLTHLTTITGYLHIHDITYPSLNQLTFLSRLSHIYGNETIEHNLKKYSLIITGVQYLRTLNLASLTEIRRGAVRIVNNPQLCLADTVNYTTLLADKTLKKHTRVNANNSPFNCIDMQVHCHDECNSTNGCWGVQPDECISCRNYKHEDTCVHQCNFNETFLESVHRECLPCHHLCQDELGCTGGSPLLGEGGCNECKNRAVLDDNSGMEVCGIAYSSVIMSYEETSLHIPTSHVQENSPTSQITHVTFEPSPTSPPMMKNFIYLTIAVSVPVLVVTVTVMVALAMILVCKKSTKKKHGRISSLQSEESYQYSSDTHYIRVTTTSGPQSTTTSASSTHPSITGPVNGLLAANSSSGKVFVYKNHPSAGSTQNSLTIATRSSSRASSFPSYRSSNASTLSNSHTNSQQLVTPQDK